VGFLTPQRNAMTLAAKDTQSTYVGLYRQVFQNGFVSGFRGGSRPTLAAIPQFTMIGPAYLIVLKETNSSSAAVFAASLGESVLTYAPQRRNAQIQFNAVRPASQHIEVQPMTRAIGPGFSFHVWRNAVAMMGIRLFTPYTSQITKLPPFNQLRPEGKAIVADLAASVVSASWSMPFNHIFSWAACTPELENMSQLDRLKAYASFLIGNYQAQGWRLLSRDICIRASYTGCLFTGYHWVERRMSEL